MLEALGPWSVNFFYPSHDAEDVIARDSTFLHGFAARWFSSCTQKPGPHERAGEVLFPDEFTGLDTRGLLLEEERLRLIEEKELARLMEAERKAFLGVQRRAHEAEVKELVAQSENQLSRGRGGTLGAR